MPKKPEQWVLDAEDKKIDPKDVLTAFIQSQPELREKLLEEGLIEEVK